MRGRIFAAVLLVAVPSCARAAIWEWPLGPYGTFRLDVPSGWAAKQQGPDAPGGRAVAVTPPQGVPLILLITPSPLSDTAPDTLLEDGARSIVARLQSVAEEPALAAERFAEGIARGFHVSATDRRVTQPTAQNFKYAIQGHLVTGRVFATFSILTNLPGGSERERALEIVRSAWHEPTAMPIPDRNGTVALARPDKPWRLLLDLPGFVFQPKEPLPQQRGVQLAGNNATTGVNVSAFLELSATGRTAADHREAHWARIRSSGPFVDVRRSERDGMALLERTFPGSAGFRIDQRHVNVHAVHDGVWMDVHLSKVRYAPQDDALFDAIIKTIRFAKKGIADEDYEAAVLRLALASPLAYFGRGSVHFRRGEHGKAIADFTHAIRLEPDFAGSYKGRALAYRRTGEPDRAVADYGEIIRLEPNNTLGYFGRGSIHQERGEIDRAIADFDQVIRMDARHAFAYEQRGRAYEHKGRRDDAIADYRKVLALSAAGPAHQRAKEGLARLGGTP